MTEEELIQFEQEIATLYEEGKIKTPVHLSGSNEKQLIRIFKDYKDGDWIFSTWRNHYHWLLSGRDPTELKDKILGGNSMHIYDKKFFTSAIVGGISPIALGVALALKLKGDTQTKVWCFLGCMGSMCGISKESIRYAEGHDLPIKFILEDNDLSVKTKTQEAWGNKIVNGSKVDYYYYKRKWPHAGTGKFVLF